MRHSYNDVRRFIFERKNGKHFVLSVLYTLICLFDMCELTNIPCKWDKELRRKYMEDD